MIYLQLGVNHAGAFLAESAPGTRLSTINHRVLYLEKQMRTRRGVSVLSVCCLALSAASCGDNQESARAGVQPGGNGSGVAIAAVTAPTNTKCIIITVVQGSTTITDQFNVSAEQSSSFNLTGLPEGNDTFSAAAYSVSCASASGSNELYVSDPVTTTVTAVPTRLTLVMRPLSGATGTVSVNFPNAAGTLAEFTIPTVSSGAQVIIAGPDGNLYFTEPVGNKIGQITTFGNISEFPIPTGHASPTWLTTGPDGNIWFVETSANQIGRMAIGTGTFDEYTIPTPSAGASQITTGADGNLWFTETQAGKIGQLMYSVGLFNEYALPAGSAPNGIVGGPDGNIWFTQNTSTTTGQEQPVGKFSLSTLSATFIASTDNSIAAMIAVGADGNLWIPDLPSNAMGKLTTAGTLTEYSVSGPVFGALSFITPGNDGTMWFSGNVLGSITPSGVVTMVQASLVGPWGIAMGADGNLWVVEGNNKVARVTP